MLFQLLNLVITRLGRYFVSTQTNQEPERKLSVITKKEVFEFSGYTLAKVLEKLPSEYIRCHKGYIINMQFVKNYNLANNIVKLDEYDIPIGRKYRANVEEAVL